MWGRCKHLFLSSFIFLFIGLCSPTNAAALHILRHTWIVEQHTPWFVLHTNNVRARKKHSQTVVHVFSSCTHAHLGGRCCIRALQNAHTESVPHLHRFKLPSGPIWRIWPPETHTYTQYLSNTQPTCSCMHAKTNMHACKNKYACAQFSYWDKECWRAVGFTFVKVCDISSNVHVSMHMLESCPDHSEDEQNISSVFQYVPKRGSRPADTHAFTDSEWGKLMRGKAGKKRLLITGVIPNKASACTV